METLLIQITDQKARKLLENLEELNLIRVLTPAPAGGNFSSKFAGKLALTPEEYQQFQAQIAKSRSEWETRTI